MSSEKKVFTLPEVLGVMALLGLLATIVFFQINKSGKETREQLKLRERKNVSFFYDGFWVRISNTSCPCERHMIIEDPNSLVSSGAEPWGVFGFACDYRRNEPDDVVFQVVNRRYVPMGHPLNKVVTFDGMVRVAELALEHQITMEEKGG